MIRFDTMVLGAFALMLGEGFALAATPLPFTETLGNLVSVGCDAEWDGPCEAGWQGQGDADTLKMVTAVSDSSIHGLMITPGTSFWNGVIRRFDVTPLDSLQFIAPVVAVGGTADFGIRVVYKNSSGVTVGITTKVQAVSGKDNVMSHTDVPGGAVTADVFLGAKNGSASGTVVVVTDAWCPGFGWGGRELEHMQPCDESACPECNVACTGDLVDTCTMDSETCLVTSVQCYCDSSGGGEPEQVLSYWN